MASITIGGNPCTTSGNLPATGTQAANLRLVNTEMENVQLSDYQGQKVVLNIFPSVNTGVCAQSVRTFNQEAAELEYTKVLCISRDLSFALTAFCGAEGIDKVETLSDFRFRDTGDHFGVELQDGPFQGLLARAVVVLDEKGAVLHQELVSEIANEPNYKAALEALMDA